MFNLIALLSTVVLAIALLWVVTEWADRQAAKQPVSRYGLPCDICGNATHDDNAHRVGLKTHVCGECVTELAEAYENARHEEYLASYSPYRVE